MLLKQGIVILLILYLTSFICIRIMKKIEPDNDWYKPYSLIIDLLTTVIIMLIVYLKTTH